MTLRKEQLATLSLEEKREMLARLLQDKARRRQFPVSVEQARLVRLASFGGDGAVLNIPCALRLQGTVEEAHVRTALETLVARHEALRTFFANEVDQLVQRIVATVDLPFGIIDLRGVEAALREAELARVAAATVGAPFDLHTAPLWRATLVRLDRDEHVFILSLHHAIADARSIAVFLRDWAALYRGESLPALDIQYGDFTQWQRSRSADPATLEFWQAQLAQARPLSLPTDRPRARLEENDGGQHATLLEPALIARLNAVARAEGATLFMILLAAFKALLARWCAQDDILIGSPTSGRNRPEVEGVIGFFAYPLALRTQLGGDPTFREILGRVKDATLSANAHQDIDFAAQSRLLGAESPLRAMFTLAEDPATGIELPDVRAEFLAIDRGLADFDIFMTLLQRPGAGVQLLLDYRSALFDAATMQEFMQGYMALLASVAADPAVRLATLPLPPALIEQRKRAQARDRRRVYTVSASFTAEPLEAPLRFWLDQLDLAADIAFAPYNQIFQQLLDPHSQLARNDFGANLVLLRFEDWTRFEPDITADKLRATLAEFVAAVQQAALRTRAPVFICVCAVAPAATRQGVFAELALSLRDALRDTRGVQVWTADAVSALYPVADYYDAHADTLGHVPYTPAYFAALASFVARQLHALHQPPYKVIALDCDNTLWGGVCGEVGPQGIACGEHFLVWQRFIVAQQQAGMLVVLCSKNNPEDVEAVFQAHPEFPLQPQHIVARQVNWLPKSANLRALARELNLGLESFIFIDDNPLEIAEVEAGCPEVLALTLPTQTDLLADFMHHTWAFDRLHVTDVDRARTQQYRDNHARETARSALSFEDFIESLALKIDIAPVTEATLARASQLTQRTNQFNLTTRRRSEAEIADASLEVLTVSVSDRFGDYGLVGLMMFAPQDSVIDVDTFLLSCRVLGRGVEHAMLAHLGQLATERGAPQVRLHFRTSDKNAPARAFFETVTAAPLAAAECYVDLPVAVARAARFVPTAAETSHGGGAGATPAVLTASGSMPAGVTRARLAHFASLRPAEVLAQLQTQRRSAAPGGVQVAPRTATEATLAEHWQALLQIESVGIHDDFFALGGHSLMATQLLSQVQRSFGVQLGLRALFEAPTIAELAARIEEGRQFQGEEAAGSMVIAPRPAHLPLSYEQESLWFIEALQPGNPLYNTAFTIEVRGPLVAAVLEAAVNAVVARHEALRTVFVRGEQGPEQKILPVQRILIPQEDVSDDAEMNRRAQEEGSAPFNFATGPLLRLRLFRRSESANLMVLTIHHIVSDRWSLGIIAHEIAAFYQAQLTGDETGLGPPGLQYADFALWQRRELEAGGLARGLDYWRKRLAGAPLVLELPGDKPRPAVRRARGAIESFVLPAEIVRKVNVFAQTQQATIFMVLLAAFKVLIHRYTGKEDLLVGSPIAGRSRVEMHDTVGLFVNALVLRSDLSGNPDFRSTVARVKDATLDAFAHADVPFEKLVQALAPARDNSRSPLVQIMFILQNTPDITLRFGGIDATLAPIDIGVSKFDLILVLEDSSDVSGGMRGYLEYDSDLFEAKTIQRFANHYVALMTAALEFETHPIDRLPFVTSTELTSMVCAPGEDIERILPLTFMQRDLYFEALVNRDTLANSQGLMIEIRGVFDLQKWEQATQASMQTQSVLRTRIAPCAAPYAEPGYQLVFRRMPIIIDHLDWSSSCADSKLLSRLSELVYRSYDLAHDPLIRHCIVKIAADRHFFVLAVNHLIFDGIATTAHAIDVCRRYEALMGGMEPVPPPPDLFPDYVAYNRLEFDRPETLAFWRQRLSAVEPLDFPPVDGDGSLVRQARLVEDAHLAAVRKYCRANRITPPMYFKCLYGVLLAQYCRAEADFVVNEVVGGRPPGHGDSLGCYYQQIPFIFSLQALDGGVAELFTHARDYRKQIVDNERVSGYALRKLVPQGRLSFLYNFYNFATTLDFMGQQAPIHQLKPNAPSGHVQLILSLPDGHLEISLHYRKGEFADHRLLERLVQLSRQVIAGATLLRELNTVLPDEALQLRDWRTRAHDYDRSLDVVALVEARVRAQPQAVAAIYGNEHLTYSDLNAKANQVAHYLRAKGVGPRSLVGICVERSFEMLIGVLGIVKSGGAYVPMDASYPAERLQFILNDATGAVLLTQTAIGHRLGQGVFLDDWRTFSAYSQENPEPAAKSHDLFYVIYTSGSTGRPKGAAVYRAGALNLYQWYARELGMTANDKVLLISAFGFDLTQKNLFAPLMQGATVVIPKQTDYDPAYLSSVIKKEQITWINCAPSPFYPLVAEGSRFASLRSLRQVVLGGEPIRIQQLSAWLRDQDCYAEIVNSYGPTECTDIATFYRFSDPAAFAGRPVPLGRPNDNVELYVLDPARRMLPPGLVGELYIGGAGVGAGYVGNPELTSQHFISNPFGSGLIYRTGDLVYYETNGNLQYVGRADFQVKLRGLRIELGEIEAVLLEQPEIDEAVVLVRDERLLAYVCGQGLERASLRARLRACLPEYMVPQAFLWREVLPQNAHGKVDRAALQSATDDIEARPYVPPEGATEVALAEIWSRILDCERVARDDNFFELGGHSLLAAQVATKVHERFGVQLPLRLLFDSPTVADIAVYIDVLRPAVAAQMGEEDLEEGMI